MVNDYLELIQKSAFKGYSEWRNKIVTLSCYYFVQLQSASDESKGKSYTEGWKGAADKMLESIKIHEVNHILIPINHANHWTLVSMDCHERIFHLYDSRKGNLT